MRKRKKLFAICDLEEDYVVRLAAYLNEHGDLPYEVLAFTNPDCFMQYAADHPIEILLISPEAMSDNIRKLNVKRTIILSDGEEAASVRGMPSIDKYQNSYSIRRQVMSAAGEDAGENVPEDCLLIGVYSPVGRCGKTMFALTLAQMIGEERRTLYLNLESYSGFESLFQKTYYSDLTDMIYMAKKNIITSREMTGNVKDGTERDGEGKFENARAGKEEAGNERTGNKWGIDESIGYGQVRNEQAGKEGSTDNRDGNDESGNTSDEEAESSMAFDGGPIARGGFAKAATMNMEEIYGERKEPGSVIQTVGNFDYVPPAFFPEDINTVSMQDLRSFISYIASFGNYQSIILDIGQQMTDIQLLLKMCTRIYMPVLPDPVSRAKVIQFENDMEALSLRDLAMSMVRLYLPNTDMRSSGTGMIDDLVYGEMGRFVGLLLEEEKRNNHLAA